jgi:MoaA/NifB/PqqE/SkfB family radical SAM enzyme
MIVLWRITEVCNFGCAFCAYDRSLKRARRNGDPDEVMRFGRLLGDYAKATRTPLLLSWLGGEPLLWPPLFEISKGLRAEHALNISATTNGSTLHQKPTREAILSSFQELTVSVDGLEATHDAMRKFKSSWVRLRDGVTALLAEAKERALGFRVRANVVLTAHNLGEFQALCHMLADWGVSEITFNQLGGRDRPEYFPVNRLQGEHVRILRQMIAPLRAELASRGVRLCASDLYLDRLHASAHDQKLAVNDCAPGHGFLFIDEAGVVAPCSFTGHDYGVSTKDLRSVEDIAALPQMFAKARACKMMTVCNDCPSTQVFGKFAV